MPASRAGRKATLTKERRRRKSRPAVTPAARRRRKLAIALAFLALMVVALLLMEPVMRNLRASRELKAKEQELERERARTEALQERVKEASDPSFLEEAARKLGYVKPGEIPIFIAEEEGETEDTPQASP